MRIWSESVTIKGGWEDGLQRFRLTEAASRRDAEGIPFDAPPVQNKEGNKKSKEAMKMMFPKIFRRSHQLCYLEKKWRPCVLLWISLFVNGFILFFWTLIRSIKHKMCNT